ncbi:MAG: DUF1127 domain-containing protein [Rhodospirillales bacterium]|nr:DUF1127 domain-containing protein [Rhodospirillales bacterium]
MTTALLQSHSSPSQTAWNAAGAISTTTTRRAVTIVARLYYLWQRRRDTRILQGLSDELLCDIGLSRMDVALARTLPFGRDPTQVLAHTAEERRRCGEPGSIHRC